MHLKNGMFEYLFTRIYYKDNLMFLNISAADWKLNAGRILKAVF